ncbi:MAG: hypothetical protein JW990_08060 [Thermoleophilia bacterium]|nr:hypothetical protein [Thermoleophilia bacterium]
MSNWFSRILMGKEPESVPITLRRFTASESTLSKDVKPEEGGWVVEAAETTAVRLFEVRDTGAEQCLLTYRATMKCENLEGRAFLEMWCRLPGHGEFFSKGLDQPLTGTTEWSSYEVSFRLKKGQRPDLVKLNLAFEGHGKVWIKDIELLMTPKW